MENNETKNYLKEIDGLIQEFTSGIKKELRRGNMNQHQNITALAALITARANFPVKSWDLDGLDETVRYLRDHLLTQSNRQP